MWLVIGVVPRPPPGAGRSVRVEGCVRAFGRCEGACVVLCAGNELLLVGLSKRSGCHSTSQVPECVNPFGLDAPAVPSMSKRGLGAMQTPHVEAV